MALDLGHIRESARFSAEGAQPLAPSDGQRAHNAVRAPLFNVLALHKAEALLIVGPSRSGR